MVFFVVDTIIMNVGECTDAATENTMVTVFKWFDSSKLTINTDKSEAMFFGCGKPNNLRILSKEIE